MIASVTVIYGKTVSDFRLIVNGRQIYRVYYNYSHNCDMLRRFFHIKNKALKAFNGDLYLNKDLRLFVIAYHIVCHMIPEATGDMRQVNTLRLVDNIKPIFNKDQSFSFIANIW